MALRYKLLVALVLAWAQHIQCANADGGASTTGENGQYVVTVTNVEGLRVKALTAVDSVLQPYSDLEPDIVGESFGAVLIEVFDQNEDTDEKVDVCRGLKIKERQERKEYVEGKRLLPPRIYSCAPNGQLHTAAVPNDPFFSQQWGLHQPNDIDVNAPEAWDITKGNSSTIVAVIDTGVDYKHPDIAANMWKNPNEVPGNGIDDDGNGVIDDIYGYNAINDSGDPLDDQYHGSHCAGTIAGSGNNGIGIAGINWNAKIMAVKFLNSNGFGTLFDAVKAIDYVTKMHDRGVNVVLSNNSWSTSATWQPLRDAIQRHANSGILFVAAAGNSSRDSDVLPEYPAAYDLNNIVSVAAVDQNGALASFSNYGAQSVDIAAPGMMVVSLLRGSYSYMSGTSMAAPFASGALSLLIGKDPGRPYTEYIDALYDSGKPLSSLTGRIATGKMVNLAAMLVSLPPPTATASPTPLPTPINNGTPTPTPTATSTPTATPTATNSATSTATPTPKPFNLTGRVVDQSGRPIAGVFVTIVTDRYQTVVAQSGTSGEFVLASVIGPCSYSVTASAAGFKFTDFRASLPTTTVVNFTAVEDLYTVSGRVISPTGRSLSGIKVQLGTAAVVYTDSNGRFAFSISRDTAYQIQLTSPSYDIFPSDMTGVVYGDVKRLAVGRMG